MKKIISLLMAFVILLSITSGLTFNVYAATPTTGKCGENAFWNYDVDSKTLSISGTGAMNNYSSPWEKYKNEILTVTIEDGITSISRSAFSNCSSLKIISIPNSINRIDNQAFYGCDSIDTVYFGGYKAKWNRLTRYGQNDSLTKANVICKELKDNCNGTCNENISWEYNPSTKTMTFSGNGDLNLSDPIDENTPSPFTWRDVVEDDEIENVVVSDCITYVDFDSFVYFKNIKSVELGKDVKIFESLNPVGIYRPGLKYLKNVKKINIDPNNKFMTSVDGVVYNKNKTTLICYPCGRENSQYKIPDGVKSIEQNCFSYSANLKKISIPNSVKTIGSGAFYNTGIINLVIPDSVNLIENHAFSECKNLKTVKIGNGVTNIECFYGCDKLESIELGNSVEYISNNIQDGISENLKTIVLPRSLKQIGSNTFKNCYNLKDVYYSGNEKDWDKIQIGSGNYGLFTAQIHYNSTPTKQPDVNPTPGGSTGGGSTGGGGGFAPAPTPEDTDKKDEDQKPETKPAQPTAPTDTTEKPASVKVNKTQAKKKALVVYWNKTANVSGYQIQVATDKKFKKNKKTITVAKQNASKKTVKKLKAKKKYFVRVRAYKIVDGKKVYGKWSKIKSVKTK